MAALAFGADMYERLTDDGKSATAVRVEAVTEDTPAEGTDEAPATAADRDFLVRLADYVKYLYEEENERRDVLNNTTKIFLGALGFVVSVGLIKIAALEGAIDNFRAMVHGLSSSDSLVDKYMALARILLFLAAGGLFCASFLFSILVVKIWRRERLCDPEMFVLRASTMSGEAPLLSAMVADYVVAANRNHSINEEKARLLSKALLSFISALILFVFTWMLTRTVYVFWR